MAQAAALVGALRAVLRARNMTYAQLAKGLRLSEASVKRMFASRNFSLARLDQVCAVLGIEISDLARQVSQEVTAPTVLTREQEQELVAEPRLLFVAVHVLNHWSVAQILADSNMTRAECVGLLARLDRMGVIELLPNDRVRVRVSRDFTWLPAGPIHQYILAAIRDDFLATSFKSSGQQLLFNHAMLSRASNAIVQRKMRQLAAEMAELHHQDLDLPLAERTGTVLLQALRPWMPASFHGLRRTGVE